MRVQAIPTLKTNILWNSVGSFIYLFCQWMTTIIVVRISGYEDAGILSLATSVTALFYCLSLFGIRNYQVSDISGKFSDDTYVKARYATCVSALLLCILFTLLNGYSTVQTATIILYMVFKVSEALGDVYHGTIQKVGRMDYIGRSFLLRGLFMVVSFSTVLWLFSSLILSVAIMGVSTFSVVLLYDIPNSRKISNIKTKTSLTSIKRLLLENIPLCVYLVLSNVIPTLPRYTMEKMFGNALLGIYTSIATPALIIQVAASFVFTPLIAPFASAYSNRIEKDFYKLLLRCCGAILLIAVVGLIGSFLLGDWGLALLFGKSILQYSDLLMPIILCTILTAIVWFASMLLTVQRSYTGLVVGSTVGVTCSLVLTSPLLKQFGLNGASISLIISLCAQIVTFFLFFFYKNKQNFNCHVR